MPFQDTDARVIQRDITDATRWVIQQNIGAEGQICTAGMGYGAFAAVKALTAGGDLFRCAAAIDGFYDLSAGVPQTLKTLLSPQSLFNVSTNLDLMDARRAPINRASNINGAVLLIGGDAQTQAMAEALDSLQRNVTLELALTGIDSIDRMVSFLEAELKGATEEPEATASFGRSLDAQQRRAFAALVENMQGDLKALDFSRAPSANRVRRQIRNIIQRYDDDVERLVSDEQWALYGDHKALLEEQLFENLDIMQLR